jgi:alpha-methylacyl-CoA racemase
VDPQTQYDKASWPALKARLVALFQSQPQAHWCALLEGTDVCFAPVLRLAEAAQHPHLQARGIYQEDAQGVLQVAPAPRFAPLQND